MHIKSAIKSFLAICLVSYPMISSAQVDYKAIDTDINKTITSKFAADSSLSDTSIKVDTSQGIVSLTGSVDSETQASAATVIAQSTPYVKDVNTDNLSVKGSQHPIADTFITAKIRGMFIQKKLFGDKDVAVMSINVETNNGTVSLSGVADNKKQIENAIIIAKSITGVKDVVSTVTVAPAAK